MNIWGIYIMYQNTFWYISVHFWLRDDTVLIGIYRMLWYHVTVQKLLHRMLMISYQEREAI